ncbi:MAG: hypothetical protein IKK29_02455 [Christensenellaceae bacterium]|nr:hypothetical protein [Christensenellaceae bacterium]
MFYDYLLEKYGYNEPIILNEISYKDYSRSWIFKELNKLCESNSLIRYESGVYYIPTQTILGPSILNPRKVIERKYIRTDNDIIGYYSGSTFLNQLGISTQMPNTIEIYTNNERAQVRNVVVGKQKVILRKARTPITQENVAVQSFLELMNSVQPSFFDDDRKQIVEDFIIQNGISRRDITQYSEKFPASTMRTLVQSEVIYCVTQ